MRTNLFILLFLFLSFSSTVEGQINFRTELETANPISNKSDLSWEEKLDIHQNYLSTAKAEKDIKKELFAQLYIFMDYIKMKKYTEAGSAILAAEDIANKSNKIGWKGWVSYRSGLLYIRIDQEEKAIKKYEVAAEMCGMAGDSLCLGESLEQLGALNGLLDNSEEAEAYFEQAMPILRKYGQAKSLANSLNNYGIFMAIKGDYAKAIPIMEEGIEVNLKNEDYVAAAKGMNNVGQTYFRQERLDEALVTYEKALKLNEARDFSQNIIRNYMGLHQIYYEKGEFQKATEFLIKRNKLKDSLASAEMKFTIAEMEADYAEKNQELEMEKAKSTQERIVGVFLLLSLLLGAGIWYFRTKSKQAKAQKQEAEQSLKKLTQILINKNSAILSLDAKVSELTNQTEEQKTEKDLENLVSSTILTIEEWSNYKVNFEKVYPGYLRQLRVDYPSLSDAEERLFLLIKLQLKTREIAAVLGISAESVKKTRYRLRKRLDLSKEMDLEVFVQGY